MVWQFLINVKYIYQIDLAILVLGIYSSEMKTYIHTEISKWVFVQNLLKSKYPSTDEWINCVISINGILLNNEKE